MTYQRNQNNKHDNIYNDFKAVRDLTCALAKDLSDADATVQSMEDASPAKWHLAHTTWFFETLILKEYVADYVIFDDQFPFLFNSYYENLGERHPRPMRGMLTRPTLEKVFAYRRYVDAAMAKLLENTPSDDLVTLLELGLNHEQQHQELFLTDILHMFAQNPIKPAYREDEKTSDKISELQPLKWVHFDGGLHKFGHEGNGFAFDAEGPSHSFYLAPFKIASRCVTNGEWIEFINAGGYETATLWLSDGWAEVKNNQWQAPLYWQKRKDTWWHMTLKGMQPVDLNAPVTHINYFEADAYARFVDKRLPTEYEWEHAANTQPISGNLMAQGSLNPQPAPAGNLSQMFGDVWEWTQSPFTAYPGFKPAHGAIGEYNGKFMCGQFILRGGSCVTPPNHMRKTYRNFFHPDKRWQFSGLRLADDA